MIISHKFRFIFLKTRKTAGTSIEFWLQRHCAASDVVTPIEPHEPGHTPRNYHGFFNALPELLGREYEPESVLRSWKRSVGDLVRRRKFYNHISGRLVRARIPSEIWNGYWKWCVERPPVEKVISDYFMQRSHDPQLTIDHYLEFYPLPINFPIYCDRGYTALVDQIIDYQNLEPALKGLASRLGIPFEGFTQRVKANYKPAGIRAKDVITPTQEARVLQRFSRELLVHREMGIRG